MIHETIKGFLDDFSNQFFFTPNIFRELKETIPFAGIIPLFLTIIIKSSIIHHHSDIRVDCLYFSQCLVSDIINFFLNC